MRTRRRICILTDGYLDLFTAKTAVGLLRYCPEEVVVVVDSHHAGGDLASLVGCGAGVPIVDSIPAATTYQPDHLVIGVALPGSRFPDTWRRHILDGLAAGMHVVNGLHTRLANDPEIVAAANRAQRRIVDVRAVPQPREVGTARARSTRARRVLTVGTDCNLGKRLTAMELTRALQARGLHAEFVATGQTGVMITGRGIVVDAVLSDFVSGAVEAEVLERGDADVVVVEGQGALLHPSYSAVSTGLLHGAVPDRMILCHAPSRSRFRNTDVPLPPLPETIRLHEALLRPLHAGRVAGVALNCHGMTEDAYRETLDRIRSETGLPTVDCIRDGADVLVDAVLAEDVSDP